MKHVFTLLFLLCAANIFASPRFAAAPTQAPTNFKATTNDGDRINLNWTSGNGARRLIIARKQAAVSFVPVNGVNYGASLTFGAGNEVADGEFVVFNNTQSSATISGLQPATQYYFAIYEFNGTGTDIAYFISDVKTSGTTISAPTAQPTGLAASSINGNSLKLTWTNPLAAGGGGTGRILIGREASPVNVNPVDLSNYTANTTFGLGSQIGNGNYVIIETSSATVTVTTLKPNTTYYFSLFEYKGSNGLVYNITAPATIAVTTLPKPTIAASSPSFSLIEGSTMKFAFAKGNGSRRIVVAKAGSAVTRLPVDRVDYTANTAFGTAATEIAPGSGEYVVANGNITDVSVSGLAKATTYYFAVFEYDGSGSVAAYYSAAPLLASQATASAPLSPAIGLVIGSVQNNSVTVSWTAGDGAKRLVVMRKDGPLTATPTDLTQYGGSAVYGSGSQVGTGNYVVYNSTGNSVTVTGLAAGATYHLAVYEYNGSSSPVYLVANAPAAQFSTSQAPTQAVSTFQWSNVEGNRLTLAYSGGNGTQRLVVLKAGSAVTATPVNGMIYSANASFGSGDVLATGEYVMAAGNTGQTTFLNLQPGTEYHAAVFEYNLVNGQPAYLTTPGRSNQMTVSVPTTQASNLQFSNVTGNSMKISWTAGNGAKRLVVVRAGGAVNAAPASFVYYAANANFGSGANLGNGNYAVLSDNTNSVTVFNLSTSTTYHVAVYEYNGVSYPTYLTASPLIGSQQTAERPSVPATGVNVVSIEGNRMTVRWTKGNGTRRLVVGSATGPVTALPQDGREYTTNDIFGGGEVLSTGQFALQATNETEVTVTGLQPGTTYYYAVFEYDGTGSTTRYLTAATGSISSKTVSAPAAGPANVLFASIGTGTATINWTQAAADRHLVVVRKGSPVTALPQQLSAYQSSTFFGHNSTVLAPDQYVVYNASSSAVAVTNLEAGTTYYVSVFAFNGNLGPVYNTAEVATSSFTTLGPPSVAATNVRAVSTGSETSVNIRWTPGSGQKRLVILRAGAPVSVKPSDNTLYAANTFFGSGQDLGSGNYAVFAGSADNVSVSNLQKNAVYYIAVFEYNQFSSGPVYLTSTYAQGQFAGSILPVKLISFSGAVRESANELQWSTAQENGVAEFVVERSANGREFTAIGQVTATGNSASARHYRYEDNSRLPLSFYRLKMVDVNGSINYSNVLRLQSSAAESISLFPTVASSELQVTLTATASGKGLLRIVGLGGQCVKQQAISLSRGVNSLPVNVATLSSGQYILQVDIDGQQRTARFFKQ